MEKKYQRYPSGQPMDIPYRIDKGFLSFDCETDADDFCDMFGIVCPRYCAGGFMNALRLSDLP